MDQFEHMVKYIYQALLWFFDMKSLVYILMIYFLGFDDSQTLHEKSQCTLCLVGEETDIFSL